ncbi:MAG TPA: hypothetical protein VEF34_13115 [Syntrophobacteraceae bacterium]|nr:hypothetical protein [Syntrophobacteraceae bacterium]
MSKGLIVVFAIALVVLSGSFFSVLADCGCLPHMSASCPGGCQAAAKGDYDNANAPCQGAYQRGPTVPTINGVPIL